MDKTFAPIRGDIVLQNETGMLFPSYQDFLEFQHLYSSAVREIQTRLAVLSEEFSVRYAHNPIHHVESRLKSDKSIIEKLRRKGLPISMDAARENINDIAGIRVVCCYIDDVYRVEEMLLRQSDMELVKRQDYIAQPNYNGYRSLHLDLPSTSPTAGSPSWWRSRSAPWPWTSGQAWSTTSATRRTAASFRRASTRRCSPAATRLPPSTARCRRCTARSRASSEPSPSFPVLRLFVPVPKNPPPRHVRAGAVPFFILPGCR